MILLKYEVASLRQNPPMAGWHSFAVVGLRLLPPIPKAAVWSLTNVHFFFSSVPRNKNRASGGYRREPCPQPREPCANRREPCPQPREPCANRREPCYQRRAPLNYRRDPCNQPRAPLNYRREPCYQSREPLVNSRVNIWQQQSPKFL
jgi:hypothetical protein